MIRPSIAAVALLFVVAGCPADSPLSETGGEETTSSASGTTAEPPTTGETTGATSGTSGEPVTSGGTSTSTDPTGGTTTTGAPGDTGSTGSSSGGTDTGGDTTTGTDTGGESTSTGDESTTGECTELGADAEMTAMDLEAAVDGVLYSSEGDYPWTVFTFACMGPVTAENIKEIIAPIYVQNPNEAPLAERVVEVKSAKEFFDKLTVPQDWWDDGYYEQAAKYVPIRMIMEENLTDLQVFRLGELSGNNLQGAIDVYIIGRSGEDLVGMWTVSIET